MTLRQRNFIFEKFPEIFKTKSKADIFEILNAVFFLIKTGCQWKLLPNEFPRWRTVYEFYRKWISTGFFDRLSRELNFVARDRQRKSTLPTVAVVDSQSIRTGLPHSIKGVDGGKKIKGFYTPQKELHWRRAQCLCCGSFNSTSYPVHHQYLYPLLSVAQVTIAPANRHASASACFGHNATALLPHCANTSA